MPLPVVGDVGRSESENILVSQFGVNQVAVIVDLLQAVREEGATPGKPHKLADDGSAVTQIAFFAYHINLCVGFFGQLLHIRKSVAAGVVLSISDKDQR